MRCGDHLLARAAFHEAGHAVAAVHYRLPIREVVIREDGSGNTSYACHLGLAEAERWTITTYAGGEAEFDEFRDRRGDRFDLLAIDNMLERLQLDWDESRLADLRRQARRLVERERHGIRVVADALIRHRHLSATDVRWLKACSVPRPSVER
jgi:hypothetical protein